MTIGKNYHALLSGDTNSLAYPAASRWITTGIHNERNHDRLCEFYHRYGYHKDEKCNLEADHLGIELLFVNLLLEKYLIEDDHEIKEMMRKDLLSFIKDEMLRWLPRWAETVSERSFTKCYIGISGLIIGGLEDVRDILRSQKFGL
jgi:TorA maturation chaperone TorD